MKVKTPKTKAGTPDKNFSKAMKVETPKSKTPKQDKINTPKSALNFNTPKGKTPKSALNLNTPKGKTPKSDKVNTPVIKTPKQEKLQTPKQEKSKTPKQDKLKTPKANGNSPKENSPKKLKTESPIAKSPKKEKQIKPKSVDVEPKSFNVYVTLGSLLRSKDSKMDACLKNTISEVLNVMNEGRLTATGSLCFQFQEETAALKSLETIENFKFKEADFKVDMSKNTYEPSQRLVNIGKDVNVCVYEEAMKKAFKAIKAEPLLNKKSGYTGLSILTFSSAEDATAAENVKFEYAGKPRNIRPYVNYESTRPKLSEEKVQKKLENQKSLLTKVEKTKKEKVNGVKRKAEVMEEVEEDDDDDEDEVEEDDDEELETEEVEGSDDDAEEDDDDDDDAEEDDDDDDDEDE